MKIPYIEITKVDDFTRILLIEDLLFSEDQKELFANYIEFWHLTNSFLLALEHYFKFESIASVKECIDYKKEIDKLYKKNIVKQENSIYLKLISDPNYDYKSVIYDTQDLTPSSDIKLSFTDLIKLAEIESNAENKIVQNLNNLPTKPGRGQKLCKNKECQKVIGARSLTCKYCGE